VHPALHSFPTRRSSDLLPRIAEALRAHPALNASWRDGYIEYYEDINVGVAVDTPRGLLVPVIRHVDGKVPVEIHTELQALAEQRSEEHTSELQSRENLV